MHGPTRLSGSPRLRPTALPLSGHARSRDRRQPQSGRQDLNLRPPGPQPGALPDCATPRGGPMIETGAPAKGSLYPKRATGLEPVLGAWKAPVQPVTLRPRVVLAMVAG